MKYLIDTQRINPFAMERYVPIEITDMVQFEETLKLFNVGITSILQEGKDDHVIITIKSTVHHEPRVY